VVLGSLLVLAGWALAGAGLARPSRRWLGGALGVASYFVVGAVWTTVFVLVDPWTVDYGRVDLVRFVLYSVVLWPYALAYAAGWFGLAGL
jgi:hypothetical protein